MPSLRELRHRDALSQRCDGRLGTSLTSRRRRRRTRPARRGGQSRRSRTRCPRRRRIAARTAQSPHYVACRAAECLWRGGGDSLVRPRPGTWFQRRSGRRWSYLDLGAIGELLILRDRARRPRLLADGASATLGQRPVAAEAARWLSEVTCARFGARRRQRVGAAGRGGDAGRNASHAAARRSTTRSANRRGKPQRASPRVAASPCRPARWAGSPAAVRADLEAPQQQAPRRALAPTRTLKLRGSPGRARTWSIAPRSPSIPGALRRGVLG